MPAKGSNKRPRKGAKSRASGRLFRIGVKLAVAAIFVMAVAVLYYGHDLPPLDGIETVKRRPALVVQDRAGRTLAAYGDVYGETVRLHDLPPQVARAVMAIEDRRFYQHWGIDLIGLARALAVNLASFRIRQGGSTITQQLAKVAFLTPERSFGRKIREALLALKIENHFTKDEILALYLNRVYFGSGAYGIDAAARRYFGRPARNLTLYQAALLAGLLRAPSRDNPHVAPERAQARTAVVLRAMEESGFISAAQRAAALRAKTVVVPRPEAAGPRYFTDWVVDLVPDYVTVGREDLVIRTTFDADVQAAAVAAMRAALKEGSAAGVRQGALVAMAPNGAVKAMVGGADYTASQFNRAVRALRQPGSTFKLFVLIAALEDGYRITDRFLDAPVRVGAWRPRNHGDRYLGEVSIADAMALSLNSVAVRLVQRVGARRVAAVAHRFGIESLIPADAAIALGTAEVTLLEMTGAYAALANRGRRSQPHAILEIRDRTGRVLYRRPTGASERVIEEAVLRDVHTVLHAVTTRGTARQAGLPQPAYGKTGTSQDYRDAWFIGYNSSLVAGVWMGNDDRTPMRDVTGGDLPAQAWASFMRKAVDGRLERLDADAPLSRR